MKLRSTLAIAVASLISLGGVAEAQYRWVDADGRVHYSNIRPVAPTPPQDPEPAKAPAEPKALSPEAARGPTDPKALIEEVLELSGTKKQISEFTAAVQAQLAERKAEMRPTDYTRAGQVIAESYRFDALYQAVVETFKRRYDEQRLLAVARELRSPLFKRITQLEARAAAPERMEKIRAFATRLRHDPPPPGRLALVRRLDEVVGVTETNLDIMVATLRAIATGIEPMLPPARRPKPGQLEEKLAELRAHARPQLKNELLVTLLYVYQPLTDGELGQYLAFFESETGRWYTRVAREGALTALTAAADEAGRRIGRAVSAAPAPKPVTLAAAPPKAVKASPAR